jgi:hypothetical protein
VWRRPAILLAGAIFAAGLFAAAFDPYPVPEIVVGEIAAQDGRGGLPCEIALWSGAIRPLDGRGEPLAVGKARTGGRFAALLTRSEARRRRGMLWLTVACQDHGLRVRAYEWRWYDGWITPGLEIGRVWVPRK